MKLHEIILVYCVLYWITFLLGLTAWYSPLIFMGLLTIISMYQYLYRDNDNNKTTLAEQQRDEEFMKKIREYNKQKQDKEKY